MTLQLISKDNEPTYLALNEDIVDGVIEGAGMIGKTVFITDTGAWKIVTAGDGTVVDYVRPALYSAV